MKEPWFAFYHDDFMRGTLGLTDEETGVYMKLICVLYDHGGWVTGDIQWLSRASHTHPRALRRILQALIDKGKIVSEGGRISNTRIVNEIQEQRKRKEKRGKNGKRTELKPDSNSTKEPLECHSSGVSSELKSEKVNEINEATPQKPPSPTSTSTGTGTEREELTSFSNGESESSAQAEINAALTANYEKEDSVSFSNGRLMLHNGCRQLWLDHFGGDTIELELALTQAAGYVQPQNRAKSLRVQTEAQLARILRDKRDKDARYAAAASKNRKPDKQANDDAWLDNLKSQIAAKGRQEVRPADLD
jgi:uncharacterized protein YdaU (DUF1376 family)